MTATTWSIGSWTASEGGSAIDANGCRWIIDTVTGWHGTPAPRTNPIDREQSDGTWDGDPTIPGRAIELDGRVWAPTQVLLLKAIDQLSALLVAGRRFDTLAAAEAHTTRQALVRLDGATLVVPTGDVGGKWEATFSILLYAPDPARYSSSLSTAGPVGIYTGGAGRSYPLTYPRVYGALGSTGLLSVANNGDAPVYPTLTFTGPLVNPVARLVSGAHLAFGITLGSGDLLVVTTGTPNRSAVLNTSGSVRRTLTADSAWWGLPVGASQVLFTADSGSGSLAISWRETG